MYIFCFTLMVCSTHASLDFSVPADVERWGGREMYLCNGVVVPEIGG